MIDIKGITKSFGSLQVLKGIDLHIDKGEVVSIVGPSGAGKTTLLQIIGTLDKPDSGSIMVDGIDVSSLSTKKLSDFRNQHLGFVFQFHQLLPEFTALENIMIPAFIAGKSRKEAKERAEELLAFMGLSDRASHKPAELSGGEKQRVAVARALVNNPAVILADEPSGSLDTKNKAELHQLFFDLRDKFGQTFVIVTHDEGLASITDIFVGYHDETEEDHQETLSLVKEVGFDSAFMFKYSERPGTYAAKHLPDNVSEETKIARLNELIKLQTEVSAEQNKKDEGKVFTILIENFSKRSREQMMGRTEQNKAVVIDKGNHHIGEFVKVRITGSTSATLFGEEVKE